MTVPTSGHDIEAIKKKALIWTIVGFICGGVIAGVFGLLGYLKADQEPETAKKFTKIAMIITIVVVVLYVIVGILYAVLIGVAASSGM
ncbi:hypothetical protein [Brachybacterium sp.]|uniref:hypothetical protein n=1 Tax=Brachybacterium sp. TaxID=1891286 RepID=UPI002ED1A599